MTSIWNYDWLRRGRFRHSLTMDSSSTIVEGTVYVIGAGAVGLSLAAALKSQGRKVVLVRSRPGAARGIFTTEIRFGAGTEGVRVELDQVPLCEVEEFMGPVVLAVKSHANEEVAGELAKTRTCGDLVVMQNGLGVERPFLGCGFASVMRCVLYMTSQAKADGSVEFRQVASSPIGMVAGDADRLAGCIEALSTDLFSFHGEPLIEREAWGKTIINAAFNSICPLLESDNGLFARNPWAEGVARRIVAEGVALANTRGIALDEETLMHRVMAISRASEGVMISTLQDILAGRETEIRSLNLELARIGAEAEPRQVLPVTEAFGHLVMAKSQSKASGTT